jgi:hypothetical protein
MVREPYQEKSSVEDFLDIPKPSCYDDGMSESNSGQTHPETDLPSLAALCVQSASLSLTIDKALDTLKIADRLQLEELKMNCLKFISLNIVTFLESGLLERLTQLPVYLLRDIQNFVKTKDCQKFGSFNMQLIEMNYHFSEESFEENPEAAQTPLVTELECLKLIERAETLPVEEILKFRNLLRK